MAHNDRLYRGVPFAFPTVPTPALLRRLDKVASQGVNGDEGGLWAPKTPIVIGGAGVSVGSAGGFTGGIATTPRAAPGALILGDSDWPKFSAGRTRTVLFPVEDVFSAGVDYNSAPLQTYTQGVPGAFGQSATSLTFAVPLDIKKFPIGATIASVTMRFSVGTRPTAVPGSLPDIFLLSNALSDDAFLPTPANVDAYFNAGRPQDLQVVPVNNTTVVAGSPYWVVLFDPTLTSNRFHSIAIAFTNILDMRPGL